MWRYFIDIVLDPFRENDRMIYFINQKQPHNLSNDANGSLESSDLLFFFQTKINARGCFEEDLSFTLSLSLPSVLLFTVYSLAAIYPAKSYFRWKFIALARIEASFPGGRNKESALADLALRSKNNWRPLLSPSSLIRPA